MVKVKFTLEQTMKPQRERERERERVEVYFYSFFNLGTRWGGVVNASHRSLYPQESDPVPIV